MTFQFMPPANQQDFPTDQTKQQALDAQWSTNLTGFTQQAILGDPWNATRSSNQTSYIDPTSPDAPTGGTFAPIQWPAFPGRILAYFPTISTADMLSLGDTGYTTTGATFGDIPASPCQPVATEQVPYGPYGPRGWQDEYCEWSVVRDPKTNKILRVDITCENPEYWNTLWNVDPRTVLSLYQTTLGKPQIQLADLYLSDRAGNPVIDPSTGNPVYNPLNKWNSGPVSTDTAGGAMHLTSTPNTLQTEIGLAASATTQRLIGNTDPNQLICCAQYGQLHRNSDPHIGQVVNQVVQSGTAVTLTNPPGLYIQAPDFSTYVTPDGTPASTFWTIVRGASSLPGITGNLILHATFEVPASYDYTVSDILINKAPIAWAGQIIETILMQINATAYPAKAPAAVGCVGSTPAASTLAQPLQLFHQAPFNAFYATAISTVNFPMSLLSNTTLIAPVVPPGAQNVSMVLTCATIALGPSGELPTVTFTGDGDVTATAVESMPVAYAVPGNTYPSSSTALQIVVNVAANAAIGLRGVMVTNYGQQAGPAMPALLNVQAPSAGATKKAV